MKYHVASHSVAIYINVLGAGFAKTNQIEFNTMKPENIESGLDWFQERKDLIHIDDAITYNANLFESYKNPSFDEPVFNQKYKLFYAVHMSLLDKLYRAEEKKYADILSNFLAFYKNLDDGVSQEIAAEVNDASQKLLSCFLDETNPFLKMNLFDSNLQSGLDFLAKNYTLRPELVEAHHQPNDVSLLNETTNGLATENDAQTYGSNFTHSTQNALMVQGNGTNFTDHTLNQSLRRRNSFSNHDIMLTTQQNTARLVSDHEIEQNYSFDLSDAKYIPRNHLDVAPPPIQIKQHPLLIDMLIYICKYIKKNTSIVICKFILVCIIIAVSVWVLRSILA
jgi:hypothetical protein